MCEGDAVTKKMMNEWLKSAAEAVRTLQSRYGKRHSCTPHDGAIFSKSPNWHFPTLHLKYEDTTFATESSAVHQ